MKFEHTNNPNISISCMAQLPVATVLPQTIACEQLVIPADFMAAEPNEETRKEKYQQLFVLQNV